MANESEGFSKLAAIDTSNLSDKIYQQLRQGIMSGKFRPGETLTLRPLAAALGTSIIPVRDALLRLVAERALENSHRSVRVPVMTLEQLMDIERFRILLEGEAAALAAARASDEDLNAIRLAQIKADKAYKSNNADHFLAANQEFHFTVYRAAHSDLLQSMIEKLWLQIGPHLSHVIVTMKSRRLSEIVDLGPHGRLVAAIGNKEPESARQALAADLKDSTDVYFPYRKNANEKSTKLKP